MPLPLSSVGCEDEAGRTHLIADLSAMLVTDRLQAKLSKVILGAARGAGNRSHRRVAAVGARRHQRRVLVLGRQHVDRVLRVLRLRLLAGGDACGVKVDRGRSFVGGRHVRARDGGTEIFE